MKKTTFTSRRVFIKSFGKENQDFLQLFGIYKMTIDPSLAYETFLRLYCSETLLGIDFTLFSSGSRRVGFSAAFFYSATLNGKPSFIARSATGLMEEFQGQGLHNKFDLYFKFIRFALAHPFQPLWATLFVVNPFVFAALCKLVPSFFPRAEKTIPTTVEKIMIDIVDGSGHQRGKLHPYSVDVPIQVVFNEKLLKRIQDSDDFHVGWYLQQNPGFLEKRALLVVIDVSVKNICGTLENFVLCFCNKNLNRLYKEVENKVTITKRRIIGFFKTAANKWTLQEKIN